MTARGEETFCVPHFEAVPRRLGYCMCKVCRKPWDLVWWKELGAYAVPVMYGVSLRVDLLLSRKKQSRTFNAYAHRAYAMRYCQVVDERGAAGRRREAGGRATRASPRAPKSVVQVFVFR